MLKQLKHHEHIIITTPNNCYNNYCNMQIKATKHILRISQSGTTITLVETYDNIQREPLHHGKI